MTSSSIISHKSSRTPHKIQFKISLSTDETKTIAFTKDIVGVDVVRAFASGYSIRLASFATTNADILDGKVMSLVRVAFSDADALFPLTDVGVPSNVDIVLNLQTSSGVSAFNFMEVSALDFPAPETTVELLFDVEAYGY